MKKLLSILLTSVILVGMTACKTEDVDYVINQEEISGVFTDAYDGYEEEIFLDSLISTSNSSFQIYDVHGEAFFYDLLLNEVIWITVTNHTQGHTYELHSIIDELSHDNIRAVIYSENNNEADESQFLTDFTNENDITLEFLPEINTDITFTFSFSTSNIGSVLND